jgi:hypothetical protein
MRKNLNIKFNFLNKKIYSYHNNIIYYPSIQHKKYINFKIYLNLKINKLKKNSLNSINSHSIHLIIIHKKIIYNKIPFHPILISYNHNTSLFLFQPLNKITILPTSIISIILKSLFQVKIYKIVIIHLNLNNLHRSKIVILLTLISIIVFN